MDFHEPVEHEELRRSVRLFLDRELPETRIREMDRARRIPRDLWRQFGAVGWIGLSIPTQYGGVGADLTTEIVFCEEVARRFPSLVAGWIVQSMAGRTLLEWGTEQQRMELLPRLARGDWIMAFGLTEPGGGTDVLGLKTRASLEDGKWKLFGQKLYTTLADDSDAILVLCRTDPAEEGRRASGLSLILTPRQQPNVEVRRLELMAMRAAATCEVFLDDARAPASNLIGQRGRGWHHLRASLNVERILAASMSAGMVAGALDQALQYALDRQTFGRPIGAYQAVQHPLAEVACDLQQVRLLIAKAAWLLVHGEDCTNEAAMAKLSASEAAIRATDKCMRVLAGYGLVEVSPLERLCRDARLQPFSPISNEMAKNVIAERLGLPRSY